MSVEKSFNEFIRLHERKLMTKDVDALEEEMTSVINRASSILGELGGSELNDAIVALTEGLEQLQKVLVKHELYEL